MKSIFIIIGVALTAGITWYLGSPLLIDDVVDEAFPIVEQLPPPADPYEGMEEEDKKMMEMMEEMTVEDVEAMPEEERMEMMEEVQEVATQMPDMVMDEAMPKFYRGMEEVETWLPKKEDIQEPKIAPPPQLEPTPEPEPEPELPPPEDIPIAELPNNEPVVELEPVAASQPILLTTGEFQDADSFHKGSGTATIYELPDGSNLLRLQNFSVTNGPALSVYLTKEGGTSPGSGFADLGKLKGNMGNQNYILPANINPEDFAGVLIYCVPFKVPFSSAALK